MKTKHFAALAFAVFLVNSSSGDDLAKSKKGHRSGPGLLIGTNLSYYHNGYTNTSSGKTENRGPSSYIGFMPNVQFPIAGNWAASVGLGINSYHDIDNSGTYHDEEKENYLGPSLELYRYCEDPCDEDDWYPFAGIGVSRYSGSRIFTNTDDNDPMHIVHRQEGKITNTNFGFFGGAYYALGGNFGLLGKINLLDLSLHQTIPNKTNTTNYYSSNHFNFFNGGSLGLYFNIGSKNKEKK